MVLRKIYLFFILLIIIKGHVSITVRMERLKVLDCVPVQGGIDFEINVRSLLECVIICTKSLSCDFLYFNQSVSICTGVHESLAQELVKTETMGDLYKSKAQRICRTNEYEYWWEIDVCVAFSETPATWTASELKCNNDGGHLFASETLIKDTIFLPRLETARLIHNEDRWWIGLSDQFMEGNFTWVSGSVMLYENWNDNQPDDDCDMGRNADCVTYTFRTLDGTGFAWYDRVCRDSLYYVCENRDFK